MSSYRHRSITIPSVAAQIDVTRMVHKRASTNLNEHHYNNERNYDILL